MTDKNKDRRKYWGWGLEDFKVEGALIRVKRLNAMFNLGDKLTHFPAPKLATISLPHPRFQLPPSVSGICSSDHYDRVCHTYGASFRDILRSLDSQFDYAPDYVAFPKTEDDIMEIMKFCEKKNVALIPYGGGSSVVGGVEAFEIDSVDGKLLYSGIISLDMKYFNKLLEVDRKSRSVHFQAGIYGPELEANLKPLGYSLRHFPQSFEFSTLGGWIATRSGGHFATRYTHIDDFVESVRIVTPSGVLETPRLPASGAGPDGARLFLGSEGTLGVITSAWLRVQDRPKYRTSVVVRFPTFELGAEAVRLISQSGVAPSNCRLIDNFESMFNMLGDGRHTCLILGFESAYIKDFSAIMNSLLEMCKSCKGEWDQVQSSTSDESQSSKSRGSGSADKWKQSFTSAPYIRDTNASYGFIVDTVESCVTWDKFPEFYKGVKNALRSAVNKHCQGKGIVTCRFTHVYADGPAPYMTVIAAGFGTLQDRVNQWDQIKRAASDAILKYGGTITHHHAVGRDHTPHYQREVDPLYLKTLAQIKRGLDPKWIMNPGVLVQIEKHSKL